MAGNNLVDIESTTGGSASGSWATVPDLSASGITVQSTSSVVLLIATVTIADQSTDNGADFRFSVNGSPTGSPIGRAGSDSINSESYSMTLVWAVDGLSGSSNSFALEWITTTGSGATPAIETANPHTLQVIEIENGASILVDESSTGSATSAATLANLFQATGVDVAGTDSILLMIGIVPMEYNGDAGVSFVFGVDNTAEGAQVAVAVDDTQFDNSFCGMHVKTGISGTHTFELKWQTDVGANSPVSTEHLRTFQIVEITADCSILASLSATSSWSPGASFANDPSLDTDQTPNGTDSLVLAFANVSLTPDSGDDILEFAIGLNDTEDGPYTRCFNDDVDMATGCCVAKAWTGLSGSNSFQLRGRFQQGTTGVDTGYSRTLFVLDFETAAGGGTPVPVFREHYRMMKAA
jgi:hypothetical protein